MKFYLTYEIHSSLMN